MEFKLTITLGNDAMQTPEDIGRALIATADKLKDGIGGILCFSDTPITTAEAGVIRDVNGNKVGKWEVTEKTNLAQEIITELDSWTWPVAATKEHEAMPMINAARVREIIKRKLST